MIFWYTSWGINEIWINAKEKFDHLSIYLIISVGRDF